MTQFLLVKILRMLVIIDSSNFLDFPQSRLFMKQFYEFHSIQQMTKPHCRHHNFKAKLGHRKSVSFRETKRFSGHFPRPEIIDRAHIQSGKTTATTIRHIHRCRPSSKLNTEIETETCSIASQLLAVLILRRARQLALFVCSRCKNKTVSLFCLK